MSRVFAIIPAFNEEESIAGVVRSAQAFVTAVVVGDNNSRDASALRAREAGAIVVPAPIQGYGSACLAAVEHVRATLAPMPDDILLFMDADACDEPAKIPDVIGPVARSEADLVIGSRVKLADAHALTRQQTFGNYLATRLIRLIWRHHYTDLGPFRAIRWSSYESLNMCDPNYGWTVEMQIKALRHRIRVAEIDVPYRARRAGVSKIAGSFTGSIKAGYKILSLIARYGLERKAVAH
jgi:glycosyltransferase involved in cell wall biosynthesis